MSYKTPGITVTNEYENLVNPSVGGDLLMAILAGVDVTNLNIHPTKVSEIRKESLGASATVDIGWFTKPSSVLSDVTDANRIISVYQGSTAYTINTTGENAVGDAFVEMVSMIRDSSGSDDVSTTSTITSDATGVRAVYSYSLETGTFTYYDLTDDYTYNVDGATITITWVAGGDAPVAGATYYVLAEQAANVPANTDAYVQVLKSTGESNVGLLVYWLASATNIPDDSSVYYAGVRVEFPSGANIYTSSSEISKIYGPAVDPVDSTVVNPASFSGWLAFSEGASSVMLVPYNLNDSSSVDKALEELASTDEPNIVTSTATDDPTGSSTVNGKLANHVVSVSNNISKKYRIGLIHPYLTELDTDIDATTFANVLTEYDTITNNLNSERVLVIGPPKVQINVPIPPYGTSKKYTFGPTAANGNYLGVIAGAMMTRAGADVATSLLKKRSNAVANLLPKWDDVKLDKIASKAVTLFAKLNSQWVVRDDITSSRENLLMKSEPTITMIADNIAVEVAQILDRGLIGGKLKTPGVLNVVRDRIGGLLFKKVQNGIISMFGTPQLAVDASDPRKINVTVPIQPMFTMKYIDITFSYVSKM